MKPLPLALAAALSAAVPTGFATAGDAVLDLRADRTTTTVHTRPDATFRGTIFGDDHEIAARVGRGARLHLFAAPCAGLPEPAEIDAPAGSTSIVVVPCR